MTTIVNFNELIDNLSIDEEHDFIYDSNTFTIYVLECEGKTEGNTYYIGKTNKDVSIRFTQHKSSDNTCAWTNKYKPIKIVETYKTKDQLDEDKITKKYMIKYGINNVRGGSYTKIELDDWMIKSLEHEFTSAKDNCYNCNEKGHYYRECPLNNKFNIDKYLEVFNNMELINEEIELLEKVYEQIIILHGQILRTSGFDNNMNIRKDLDNKITKINEQLRIEQLKIEQTKKESHYINYTNIQQLEKEKRELTSKLLEVNGHRSFDSINTMCSQYFKNDNIFINSENTYIIKIYKLHINFENISD